MVINIQIFHNQNTFLSAIFWINSVYPANSMIATIPRCSDTSVSYRKSKTHHNFQCTYFKELGRDSEASIQIQCFPNSPSPNWPNSETERQHLDLREG